MRRNQPGGARVAAYMAIAIHLLLALPVLTLGIVAPGWAVILFYVGWGVLLAVAFQLLRTRPALVLAIPVVFVAVIYAILFLGENLLGFTA